MPANLLAASSDPIHTNLGVALVRMRAPVTVSFRLGIWSRARRR